MKESTRVLTALGGAIVLGIGVSMSGSASLLRAADAVAPIGTVWVNAIRMTVVPLVVCLLVTGIASASDVKTVGRLGGRTLIVFIALLSLTAALAIPLSAFVFQFLPDGVRPPLPDGAVEAAGQVASSGGQTFSAWLTSLIPTNPIAAAASGAMVPLLLFTLLMALAIVHLPPAQRSILIDFFTAVGDAMLTIVHWVVLAAPVGVFALVLPLAARAGAGFVGSIGFYIVVYSVITMVFVLLMYPVVAVAGRISMRAFGRALLPSQLIAFSSSSSIASLPALIESADQLALPPKVTGFVVPLAVATFKLAAPVSWTIGALFAGWFYHIPLGVPQLAIVAFAAVFLAFAGPGVPRGAFIMLTPLFLAIGLPAEAIGLLIAVDAIPDVFATVLNVTGDLGAAAIVSRWA